jgi:hypothetical protein
MVGDSTGNERKQPLMLRGQKAPQLGKPLAQQVVREITVSACRIATSLNRLVRSVEPKAEHSIRFSADGADASQEPLHFSLGEDKNLRRPPSSKFPPLSCIDGWIERN